MQLQTLCYLVIAGELGFSNPNALGIQYELTGQATPCCRFWVGW